MSAEPLAPSVDNSGSAAQREPVLELEEVVKTYAGDPPLRALEGVSFSIRQGELVAVVGPSGSG
jgi:ABC-type glutathione transport system ATPase component